MELAILIFTSLVFGYLQIALFNSLLPFSWRMFCVAISPIVILLNLAFSGLIVMFTGVASMVGLGNIAGSIIFGVYIYFLKSKYSPKIVFRISSNKIQLVEYNK